ncbi:hypothetical protein ONZ45_g3956 [Pleurotus djamor]|nr:hypothetical protein ONZ45_g3956 [Pleurotus djamor]
MQQTARLERHVLLVVFIACRPPVDPVTMVVSHVENVQRTGISRTRYTHRLVPSSNTCAANLPDITNLCKEVFDQFFQNNPGPSSYKIELRIRNHTTHTRDLLIPHIAACLPNNLTVKLDDPEVFILVEIFKSVCGIGVVKDYYRFQKFNIMEVGKSKGIDDNFRSVGGRLSGDKPDSESQTPTTITSAQPDT